MLNCEYCDYYESNGGQSRRQGIGNHTRCSFSGHVFSGGELEKDEEYPCRDISYQEYLDRGNEREKQHIVNGRRKLIVKRNRPAAEKVRLPIAG
ncbi:MAG TPA: hypothetical protein VHT96_10060 [Clostridia bacterium]|nr:hypothetical protein [Clostridia bacterium]